MHQEAIWESVLPSKTDPGKFEHENVIEPPRCWRVGKYQLDEHADGLAGKLAEGLVIEAGRADVHAALLISGFTPLRGK